jgi:hypothetical protein
MQTKSLMKKGLAVGIIVLLGMNIAPLVSSSSSGKVIARDKLNPPSLWGFAGLNIWVTGTKGWNDWFVSGVVITFAGGGPGVVDLFYKINNGSWTDNFTGSPIIITVDGYYTISAYFVYENGTHSRIVSVSFKIDKTPPVVTNFTVKRVGFFKWKFTANVYDSTSGVNCVLIFIDCQLIANLTSSPYEICMRFRPGFMFMVYWKFRGNFEYLPHCIPYDNAGNTIEQPNSQWR